MYFNERLLLNISSSSCYKDHCRNLYYSCLSGRCIHWNIRQREPVRETDTSCITARHHHFICLASLCCLQSFLCLWWYYCVDPSEHQTMVSSDESYYYAFTTHYDYQLLWATTLCNNNKLNHHNQCRESDLILEYNNTLAGVML